MANKPSKMFTFEVRKAYKTSQAWNDCYKNLNSLITRYRARYIRTQILRYLSYEDLTYISNTHYTVEDRK